MYFIVIKKKKHKIVFKLISKAKHILSSLINEYNRLEKKVNALPCNHYTQLKIEKKKKKVVKYPCTVDLIKARI